MRRWLVYPLEDEALLCWDEAVSRSSAGRQGGASSSCTVTRRCLVLSLEAESFIAMRNCLILLQKGEASSSLPALG
ncbi:hypothetical protein BHM03_00022695 [Ensete ventricosum]|nr:hypothetical protein BHM03_00022695 [Ensete ventricosum]